MGRVYNDEGTSHVFVETSPGNLSWSTPQSPVNLLPQADWLNVTRTVTFPDFTKFANYAYQRVSASSGNPPPWAISGSGDACQTVTMIAPGEQNISEVNIGDVPAGINYIDVRVRVTRTKNPTTLLDQQVPMLLNSGQWCSLPGGSCLIESTPIWKRLFNVELSGTTVKVTGKQSVYEVPSSYKTTYGGIYQNAAANGDAWITSNRAAWGWCANASAGFNGTQRDGHPAALIEVKQFSQNGGASVPTSGAKHPTRERACNRNVSVHDFSSVYSVEFDIRPGFIKV